MKICITNGYSLEQKGDTALLIGTAERLRAAFPQAHVAAQVAKRTAEGEQYEGIEVIDSIVYIAIAPDIGKIPRAFRMISVLVAAPAWAFISRTFKINRKLFLSKRLYTSCSALYESDLVVAVAGGYIAGKRGLLSSVNLIFVLLPLWVAHVLGKPVIYFSQSIGPLGNSFQRSIVTQTLNRARLIFTRESMSTQFAQDLHINPLKIIRSIDAGFLFTASENFGLKDAFDDINEERFRRPIVGITTKVHLEPKEQSSYEKEVAVFADWLSVEKKMTVIFIPQITSSELSEDDRILNRRVHSFMEHPAGALLVEKNLNSRDTKALIECLDYMVGTRFHSVIFALSGHVPSIAIEYEHKTRGIMRDIGLEKWIVPMNGLASSKLKTLFDEIVHEREAYREYIRSALPAYLEGQVKIKTLQSFNYI